MSIFLYPHKVVWQDSWLHYGKIPRFSLSSAQKPACSCWLETLTCPSVWERMVTCSLLSPCRLHQTLPMGTKQGRPWMTGQTPWNSRQSDPANIVRTELYIIYMTVTLKSSKCWQKATHIITCTVCCCFVTAGDGVILPAAAHWAHTLSSRRDWHLGTFPFDETQCKATVLFVTDNLLSTATHYKQRNIYIIHIWFPAHCQKAQLRAPQISPNHS